MNYVVMTLLAMACLQAARGQIMAVLYFLVIATCVHVASTMYRKP